MKKVVDSYCWQESRQVMTIKEHGIPGVETFGHSLSHRAGFPLETHIHPGCMELVVMKKGKQVYTAGGERYPLSGGNIFISFSGEEHSSGGEPQNISEFYWIQIHPEYQKGFLGLEENAGKALCQRLSAIKKRLLHGSDTLMELMENCFWNTASDSSCRREYGRSLLVTFLYEMLLQEKAERSGVSEEIGRSVSYIRENIGEEIQLETLADCAGLSLSRFKVRFKNETGITPREYVNLAKIDEAKKRLQQNQPVTQVALDLGFGSSNYFAVLFKKVTLYTPTEYREKYGQEKEGAKTKKSDKVTEG